MGADLQRVKIVASFAGLDGEAAVHAIRGREEVSRAFRYEVDFEAREIVVDDVRGSTAHLAIEDAAGRVRSISGAVVQLELLANDAATERYRYRAHLAPLPFLLAFRHGSGIFQDLSVPEVVKKVVADAGLDEPRFDLSGAYPKRDYCVQYDETEWQFVCRLLEEEGIWFSFDHTADGHTMVVADASARAAKSEPATLPFVSDPALHGDELRAWGLVRSARTCVVRTMIDDYDFAHPSVDLRASADAPDGDGVWFEYPSRALDPAVAKRIAKSRLEEQRTGRRTIRFATNSLAVQAGQRVEIADHPSQSGEYFVTAVDFHVRLEPESDGPLVDGGPAETSMRVEAIPAATTFRPARSTPRPTVAGPQTAKVTGPASEEIHCDPHGRVKLQFHWDRQGALDDKSSAWIRVVQPHTTGAVLIPRIGWEVLVDFLEGDPDRPLCTGRAYNPLFPPPYALPGEKTVTAHRSESSPGGKGINELRFDDAPGSQEVQLNAHRDLHLVAAEKMKVQVGKMHSVAVGVNNEEKVSAKEEVSVKSTQSLTVGGAHAIAAGTRGIEVGADAAEEVNGSYHLDVSGIETIKVGNPLKALVQDRKSTRLNSSHLNESRMPSSA